jgi:tRNA (Thr-GGU) A37 N-methylase
MDQTPLIDIKPYAPDYDYYPVERIGWLDKARGQVREKKSDSRFE